MKSFSSFHSPELLKDLRGLWPALANREKKWLLLALVIALGGLLWLMLLSPSIAMLRGAEEQERTLNAQLGRMRALQLDAAALQKQPVQKYDDALRALTGVTSFVLGASATLTVAGDRANVTLHEGTADALAQWLTEARANAKSVPVEVRLTRSPVGGAARWNGVVVMSLPQR
jgi:general secretion pathway protein M